MARFARFYNRACDGRSLPQREIWVYGLTGWFVLSLSFYSTLSGFDPDTRERRFGSGLLCRHPTGELVRLRGLAACPEAWFPRTMNRRSASATSNKQTVRSWGGSQVQTKPPHLLPTVLSWDVPGSPRRLSLPVSPATKRLFQRATFVKDPK